MRHSARRVVEAFAGSVILLLGLIAAMVAPADPRDRHVRRAHETSDVNMPGVLAAAAALLVGLAMVVVLSSWLETRFTGRGVRLTAPPAGVADVPSPSALAREQPRPLPLTGAPADALGALRAQETRRLTTYGWVDADAGIVRIPIDRAMDLLAARGGARGPKTEGSAR